MAFDLKRVLRHPRALDDDPSAPVTDFDFLVGYYLHDVLGEEEHKDDVSSVGENDPMVRENYRIEQMSIEEETDNEPDGESERLQERSPEEKSKPSIEDPPIMELKELPFHLEYAFLEEGFKLPVIISSDLTREERKAYGSLEATQNNHRLEAYGYQGD